MQSIKKENPAGLASCGALGVFGFVTRKLPHTRSPALAANKSERKEQTGHSNRVGAEADRMQSWVRESHEPEHERWFIDRSSAEGRELQHNAMGPGGVGDAYRRAGVTVIRRWVRLRCCRRSMYEIRDRQFSNAAPDRFGFLHNFSADGVWPEKFGAGNGHGFRWGLCSRSLGSSASHRLSSN